MIALSAIAVRPGPLRAHTHDGARELVVAVARLAEPALPARGPEVGPVPVPLNSGYTRAATLALRAHPSVLSLVTAQLAIAVLALVLLGVALERRLDSPVAASVGCLVLASGAPWFRSVEQIQHSALLPTIGTVWLASIVGQSRLPDETDLKRVDRPGWWHLLEVAAAALGSHIHVLLAPVAGLTVVRGLALLARSRRLVHRVALGVTASVIIISWWPIAVGLISADWASLRSYASSSSLAGMRLFDELGATGLLGEGGVLVVLLGLGLAIVGLAQLVRQRDRWILSAVATVAVSVGGATLVAGAHTRYLNLVAPSVAVLVAFGVASLGPRWRPSAALAVLAVQLVDPWTGVTITSSRPRSPEPDLLRCEGLIPRGPSDGSDATVGDVPPGDRVSRELSSCRVVPGGIALVALYRIANPETNTSSQRSPGLTLTARRRDRACRLSNPHVPIAWLEESWLAALRLPPSPMLTTCLGPVEPEEHIELDLNVEEGTSRRAPTGWTWMIRVVVRAPGPISLEPTGSSDPAASSWSLGDTTGLDLLVGSELVPVPMSMTGRVADAALAATAALVPAPRP